MTATEWIDDHVILSRYGARLVPQERYDALCESNPDLAAEVGELLTSFETIDRGEYAYARVLEDCP